MTPTTLIRAAAILTFGIATLLAGVASAQWRYLPAGDEIFPYPTAYVPVGSGASLSLFCAPQAGALVVLDTDESPRSGANRQSRLDIRAGGRIFRVPATYVPSEALAQGRASPDLIAALNASGGGSVSSRELGTFEFGLSGSTSSLGKALSACAGASGSAARSPSASATGGGTAALEAALLAKLEPECRSYGGRGVTIAQAAYRQTGDGITVDYHHIRCPGAMGVLAELGVGYCGAAECLQAVYVVRGGRYVVTRSFYR